MINHEINYKAFEFQADSVDENNDLIMEEIRLVKESFTPQKLLT